MSLTAVGPLGQLFEYSQHREGSRAGRRRRPRQPRTILQRANRLWATFLATEWHELAIADQASWAAAFPDSNASLYHKYLKSNFAKLTNMFGDTNNPNVTPDWPSHAYPADKSTNVANIPSINSVGLSKSLLVTLNITVEADNWFVAFFHWTGAHPAAVPAKLVNITHLHETGFHDILIENLPPGPIIILKVAVSKTGKANPSYFSIVNTILP